MDRGVDTGLYAVFPGREFARIGPIVAMSGLVCPYRGRQWPVELPDQLSHLAIPSLTQVCVRYIRSRCVYWRCKHVPVRRYAAGSWFAVSLYSHGLKLVLEAEYFD